MWAAVCSRGIIGPFFIRETVISERYVTILEQFFATQQVLENRPRTEWFMQDGARPHRTEQVFRFLDEYFGNRVIALEYPKFTGAGMDLPPYSPGLIAYDFFFVGNIERHCLLEASRHAGRA
ncbi:DDE_3 domain-containing protein [Trichonephila clavipes]|nr:DDE_3 domain-containing protein [Trichonephila clavipes]